MQQLSDLNSFYRLLAELEGRIGGLRRLADCHGRMQWPERGLYFFFEPGEQRSSDPATPRVVRVGTHALMSKSRTTLWKRLRQHRGTTTLRGGNHRGSIFRLLSGEALMNRDPLLAETSWGRGSSTTREIRQREREHESRVSAYLGAMSLSFLPIPDASGPDSARGLIERNSIALLSSFISPTPDQPSQTWLGHHSGRERVRRSGLWNNNHVDEAHDPDFLNLFEDLVRRTIPA